MARHDKKLLGVGLASVPGCLKDGAPHRGILRPGSSFVYLEVGVEHEEGGLVDEPVGLGSLIVSSLCRNFSYYETLVKKI